MFLNFDFFNQINTQEIFYGKWLCRKEMQLFGLILKIECRLQLVLLKFLDFTFHEEIIFIIS
jgi:hypothetical protein